MTPNTSAAVSYPKGELEKKFDEIVVKGEVYRACLTPKHLKAGDKKLYVSVKVTKEDYLALKKHRAFGDLPLSGLKKVMVAKRDEDGEIMLDDEDEPIKEFSHYQVTFSQNATIKGEDVDLSSKIKVKRGVNFDISNYIAEGSVVSIKGFIWDWKNPQTGELGCSVNLSAVAIHELKVLESNGGGSAFGGMGIDDDEFESVVEASSKPSSPAASSSSGESTENQETPIDFDDDIPF